MASASWWSAGTAHPPPSAGPRPPARGRARPGAAIGSAFVDEIPAVPATEDGTGGLDVLLAQTRAEGEPGLPAHVVIRPRHESVEGYGEVPCNQLEPVGPRWCSVIGALQPARARRRTTASRSVIQDQSDSEEDHRCSDAARDVSAGADNALRRLTTACLPMALPDALKRPDKECEQWDQNHLGPPGGVRFGCVAESMDLRL